MDTTVIKHRHGQLRRPAFLACVGVLALCALGSPRSGNAFEFDLGIDGLETDVNVDLRYNIGTRVEKRNTAVSLNTMFDEGDNLFDKGDVVTNRIDGVAGLNVRYFPGNFKWVDTVGFRVSGSAFHDSVYRDPTLACRKGEAPLGVPAGLFGEQSIDLSDVSVPGVAGLERVSYCDPKVTSYGDGKRSALAQKRAFKDAELLDSFVFGNFLLGEIPIGIKAGKYSLYWGESLLNPFLGVAYSMGPVDLNKAFSVPGVGAQDVFLPIKRVSATIGLLETLSVGLDKPLSWESIRAPEGGTYFSPADPFFDAPTQFYGGNVPGIGPFALAHAPTIKGDNKDAYGVQLKWDPEFMQGGSLGAYVRQFDDVLPWLGTTAANPQDNPGTIGTVGTVLGVLESLGVTPPAPLPAEVPGTYRYTYAKNSKMYGLTGTSKLFGVSIAGDLVYSPNRILNSQNLFVSEDGQAARGQVWSGVINGLYLGPKFAPFGIPLFDTSIIIAELNGSYLRKVTQNEAVYKKVGSPACRADVVGYGAGSDPEAGNGSTIDACSSKYAIGASILFQPTWYQVFSGIDVTGNLFYNVGIKNNSPAQLGGNEGFNTGSLGATANFYSKVTATLAYNYYDSQFRTGKNFDDETVITTFNGLGVLADRDWVSLTLKYSF